MPEAVGHMQIGNQCRSAVKPRHKSLKLSLLLWSLDAYAKNSVLKSVDKSSSFFVEMKSFFSLCMYVFWEIMQEMSERCQSVVAWLTDVIYPKFKVFVYFY